MKLATLTSVTAALILATNGAQAQTIFKCTGPGGAVTMQQTPCGGGTVTSATIQTSRQAPAATAATSRAERSVSSAAPAAAEPRRHWIVWTGDPRADATKAVANLDAIRVLGQGCDAQLRGRDRDLTDCQRFIDQLRPGGDFERVGHKINELLNDRSAALQVGTLEFRRVERMTDEIARLREFVMVALKQR